jgi:hypothetical protein
MMYADDRGLHRRLSGLVASEDRSARAGRREPAEILMMPENLSAEMVGPRFFELFLRDFQSRWSRKIIAAGKFSCIHMDGTLKGLLREESGIGLTFIEAMTPAPVGDLPIREWDRYRGGANVIYWGGIPGSYFTRRSATESSTATSGGAFGREARPRATCWGSPTRSPDGLERRVARVRQLVDEHGAYA